MTPRDLLVIALLAVVCWLAVIGLVTVVGWVA